jgi:hypothetical protein
MSLLNLNNIKKLIKSLCPPILWSYLNNLKHITRKPKHLIFGINSMIKKEIVDKL